MLRVIELFAGVGGFRLALERAGMRVVWSNQWEPGTRTQAASSCYVANFGVGNHSNVDIEVAIDLHEAGTSSIPDADLIVGGFPCQDYSVAKSANASLGLEGKKGVLWWQIHRLVSDVKPKLVFLENVDRLLKSPASQRGRDFAVMLRTLGDLGYSIEWQVANSADYGFPQRRIRVFIVAVRLDLIEDPERSFDLVDSLGIFATALGSRPRGAPHTFKLKDNAEDLSVNFNVGAGASPFLKAGIYQKGVVKTWDFTAPPQEPSSLGDVLLDEDQVPEEFFLEEEKVLEWEYLKGAKSIPRTSKTGHTYTYSEGKMAFPDSIDKPSRTILTGEGGSSPSRFKHVIHRRGRFRRLTPLELERLSGFPDDWTRFDSSGKEISSAKRGFFIGNALVVGLVERIGQEITKRFG